MSSDAWASCTTTHAAAETRVRHFISDCKMSCSESIVPRLNARTGVILTLKSYTNIVERGLAPAGLLELAGQGLSTRWTTTNGFLLSSVSGLNS